MSVVLVVLAGLSIAAPHLLRLDGAHPITAATIWWSAICLRALVVLSGAVYVIVYVPTTQLFELVTQWCWHTVLPGITAHLGLSGHRVGDLALLVPLLALSASLGWACVALWRTARAIRTWICRATIGPGPQRSVVVGEHDIMVVAAGLRRPRVVVSAGALMALDDDELAAGLAHEHGHIARGHRFALLTAEIAWALARFMPGTRSAIAELAFHLERDADGFAVRQRHDPVALASAICKTAHPQIAPQGALLGLSGRGVTARVRELLVEPHDHCGRGGRLDVLASAMTVLVVLLATALPAATIAGTDPGAHASASRHCQG